MTDEQLKMIEELAIQRFTTFGISEAAALNHIASAIVLAAIISRSNAANGSTK